MIGFNRRRVACAAAAEGQLSPLRRRVPPSPLRQAADTPDLRACHAATSVSRRLRSAFAAAAFFRFFNITTPFWLFDCLPILLHFHSLLRFFDATYTLPHYTLKIKYFSLMISPTMYRSPHNNTDHQITSGHREGRQQWEYRFSRMWLYQCITTTVGQNTGNSTTMYHRVNDINVTFNTDVRSAWGVTEGPRGRLHGGGSLSALTGHLRAVRPGRWGTECTGIKMWRPSTTRGQGPHWDTRGWYAETKWGWRFLISCFSHWGISFSQLSYLWGPAEDIILLTDIISILLQYHQYLVTISLASLRRLFHAPPPPPPPSPISEFASHTILFHTIID